MGREIRRVPVDWEHPKETKLEWELAKGRVVKESFVPMYKEGYLKAALEWDQEWKRWQQGEHPAQLKYDSYADKPYEEYGGRRPTPYDHFPDWDEEERDGWCVYETVSEGTPVTPVFEDPDDLIDYLATNGDFWDQRRRKEGSSMPCGPWDRERAESFVKGSGWYPSMISVGGRLSTAGHIEDVFDQTEEE